MVANETETDRLLFTIIGFLLTGICFTGILYVRTAPTWVIGFTVFPLLMGIVAGLMIVLGTWIEIK